MRVLLISAVIFLAACGAKTAPDPAADRASKPVTVSTATATTREVSAGFEETGSFVADESSDIASPVPGLVVATPVNVGDFVKAGQPVCELDRRDAQLRLDQAKAQLDEATAGVRSAQSGSSCALIAGYERAASGARSGRPRTFCLR